MSAGNAIGYGVISMRKIVSANTDGIFVSIYSFIRS